MVEIPKEFLVHTFDYQELEDTDQYNQPTYGEPQTIEHCRIDQSTVFSRDTNETKIVADAVIFCYSAHTTPFIDFREQSKVTFDGKEYTIKKVVPITMPYSSDLFAYELEVI